MSLDMIKSYYYTNYEKLNSLSLYIFSIGLFYYFPYLSVISLGIYQLYFNTKIEYNIDLKFNSLNSNFNSSEKRISSVSEYCINESNKKRKIHNIEEKKISSEMNNFNEWIDRSVDLSNANSTSFSTDNKNQDDRLIILKDNSTSFSTDNKNQDDSGTSLNILKDINKEDGFFSDIKDKNLIPIKYSSDIKTANDSEEDLPKIKEDFEKTAPILYSSDSNSESSIHWDDDISIKNLREKMNKISSTIDTTVKSNLSLKERLERVP